MHVKSGQGGNQARLWHTELGRELVLEQLSVLVDDSKSSQTGKNRRLCEAVEVWNRESGDRIKGCDDTCRHAVRFLAAVGCHLNRGLERGDRAFRETDIADRLQNPEDTVLTLYLVNGAPPKGTSRSPFRIT